MEPQISWPHEDARDPLLNLGGWRPVSVCSNDYTKLQKHFWRTVYWETEQPKDLQNHWIAPSCFTSIVLPVVHSIMYTNNAKLLFENTFVTVARLFCHMSLTEIQARLQAHTCAFVLQCQQGVKILLFSYAGVFFFISCSSSCWLTWNLQLFDNSSIFNGGNRHPLQDILNETVVRREWLMCK